MSKRSDKLFYGLAILGGIFILLIIGGLVFLKLTRVTQAKADSIAAAQTQYVQQHLTQDGPFSSSVRNVKTTAAPLRDESGLTDYQICTNAEFLESGLDADPRSTVHSLLGKDYKITVDSTEDIIACRYLNDDGTFISQ